MPTTETIEQGFGPAFFAHISENVCWIVTGTDNPISVTYPNKEATIASFMSTGAALQEPWMPKVVNILHKGDQALVELKAKGKMKNGEYVTRDAAFVCDFEGDEIVKVRTYMDSALMKRTLD